MQERMESLTGGCWGHLWGKTPSRSQLFSFCLCQVQRGEKAVSISYCLFHHENWLVSPHTVPSSPWRRTVLVVDTIP